MLTLLAPKKNIHTVVKLSGSKSIHNRLLIINHILKLGLKFKNSSTSDDTKLLKTALKKVSNTTKATINIHHAGTDMRFLTALLSVSNGEWVLTGSDRMKERPIGELVNALKNLGANINYLKQENYPPLKIKGSKIKGGEIVIDASISSQYISALLLIAASFKKGLVITLKGRAVSLPYIKMSIALLKEFGVNVKQENKVITIKQSKSIIVTPKNIYVESDWSSASYWYSICALSKNSSIELRGLQKNSLQADATLPLLYNTLGVKTYFKKNAILILNKGSVAKEFKYDFTNSPDIAQTVIVTCFGLGLKANLTGLSTLKLKESDRIVALKTELEKLGATMSITNNSIQLDQINHSKKTINKSIQTYNDHRMAMSFAPLALIYTKLKIQNPEVVSKSYPKFWEDLKSVGFSVNLQQ